MGRRALAGAAGAVALALALVLLLSLRATSTAPAESDRPPLSPRALGRLLAGSTVRLSGFGCGTSSDGTGFAFSDGRVVTNRHVVDGMRQLDAVPEVGALVPAVATVSAALDLAVVRTASGGARLGPGLALSTYDVASGAPVVVAGYPGDLGGRLRVVRAVVVDVVDGVTVGQPAGTPVLRLGVRLPHGMSGSPVVDGAGSVVGVVFGVERSTGRTLALPTAVVRSALAGTPFVAAPAC